MKFSALKSNPDLAKNGRWQKDIPGLGNVELLVRSANNPDFRRRQQAMIRALPPSKKPKGIVDPVEMDRITGVCLLDCALLDWKNVEDDSGAALPYSYEQAKTFLTEPEYAPFREGVLIAAATVEDEDRAADEATEKNSQTRSDTP